VEQDVAIGSFPDGSFNRQLLTPTPLESNRVDTLKNLYINEYMASNTISASDEFEEYDDWIELYNAGTDLLDIGGLFISDDVEDDSPFRISSEYPDSTTIKPGDYLLIWADDSTEQGILHLDFKLSSSGEEVVIFDLDRITILDSVSYKDIPTDITFGRTQDGGSNWYELATPTPSYSNILTAGEEITFVTSACNYKVYPNPAISHAVFSVETDRATQISIRVYNLSGELVNTVTDGKYPAGSYEFFWELDGSDQSRIPLGVYFYSIETDTISVRDKIIVTN
jgi:hypothetical protein